MWYKSTVIYMYMAWWFEFININLFKTWIINLILINISYFNYLYLLYPPVCGHQQCPSISICHWQVFVGFPMFGWRSSYQLQQCDAMNLWSSFMTILVIHTNKLIYLFLGIFVFSGFCVILDKCTDLIHQYNNALGLIFDHLMGKFNSEFPTLYIIPLL